MEELRELLRDLGASQGVHRGGASLAQTNDDLAAEVETLKQELEYSHRQYTILGQQNEILRGMTRHRQHEHIVQNPYHSDDYTSRVENAEELRMELITSERSRNELEVELRSLKCQVVSLKCAAQFLNGHKPKNQESMVLALIDGDGNIFCKSLLERGLDGGCEAAQALEEELRTYYVYSRRVDPWKPIQLWVYVFLNMKGLQRTLVKHNICSSKQFEEFMQGFTQSNPRFIIADVYPGLKDAADMKLNELLLFYARIPQTSLIFFGGTHDNGYFTALSQLQDQGFSSKIVLLKGYEEVAAKIRSLSLPTLEIESLFMTYRLGSRKGRIQEAMDRITVERCCRLK
ncbi:hypothetical protein JB92DRAFT_2783440 [Gautieria morchelliformis]|nr:hypothetical protein JB92DRAFT_2783440 [Gautieria morchelliformis]